MTGINQIVKIYFCQLFGWNKAIKSRTVRAILSQIGMSLLMLYLLGLAGTGWFYLLKTLAPMMKVPAAALAMMGGLSTTASLFCIIICITGQAMIFQGKDLESWFAMPASTFSLVTGKYLTLYSWLLGTVILFLAPPLVQTYIAQSFPPSAIPWMILAIIALPIIPSMIGILIGLLFTWLLKGIKQQKYLSSMLGAAIVIVFVIFWMQFTQSMTAEKMMQIILTMNKLAIYNPLSAVFAKTALAQDLPSAIFLILGSAALLFFFLLTLSRTFRTIIDGLTVSAGSKAAIITNEKLYFGSAGVVRALIVKDFRRFFSSMAILSNLGFGPLLITALSIATIFKRDSLSILFHEGADLIPGNYILLILILLMLGLTNITATSLSLEGKMFPLLKSFPIAPMTIFRAKASMNMLLTLPFAIINIAILGIFFQLPLTEIGLLLTLSMLTSMMVSCLGLLSNLLFPSFDWVNETIIVKRSMASFCGIFGGLLFTAAPFLLTIKLYERGFLIAVGVPTLVMAGLVTLFILLLRIWGAKRFSSLSNF